MRVALDMTATTTGITGVARYAAELAKGLALEDVQLLPYALGRGPYAPPAGTRRVAVPLRLLQRTWAVAGVPRAEHLVPRPDLVHCLDLLPTPSRRPVLMTAHDLVAVLHPGLHSEAQVSTQRRQLRAYRRAAHVIADSQSTADALVAHGIDSRRISVALLGRTPLPTAAPLPITSPYLLVVGEVAARKNLPTLIHAFRQARLPRELRLVLAGPPGFRADQTHALLGEDVIALGRVSDEVLAALYQSARALCFPSVAEGFGLPLLEAMHVGIPVLASDINVLREVAGDVARYVPPLDVRAWARALEDLIADEAAARDRAATGRGRAREFTWTRTAATTVSAYRKVLTCA